MSCIECGIKAPYGRALCERCFDKAMRAIGRAIKKIGQ